jgi:hypothetical protein
MPKRTKSNQNASYGFFADVFDNKPEPKQKNQPRPSSKVVNKNYNLSKFDEDRPLSYPLEFAKSIHQPFAPGPTMYAIRHIEITKEQFLKKIRKHEWFKDQTEEERNLTWKCVVAQRHRMQDIWEERYYCCFTPNCKKIIQKIKENEIN